MTGPSNVSTKSAEAGVAAIAHSATAASRVVTKARIVFLRSTK
jgi:hypothetical protein